MRLLIWICFITLAPSLSFVSMAQDKPADAKPFDAKPAETQTSKDHSKEDMAKPSGEDRSEKVEAEDDSFDIDSFFKKGEENSKKGFGCDRPPEPIT